MNKIKFDDSRFFDAHRLKDLGDGIFAFAMTFLIVTIDLPKTSSAMLNTELIKMVTDILTYILSFFLLAIFWMTNHIQMKAIKRADSRLAWINILLFLCIVFVPLTSDLYAFYENSCVTMLAFNLNILCIGLVFMLQWHHLVANSMHHEAFTAEEVRDRYYVCSTLIVVAIAAIILGFFYPASSPLVYFIMGSYRIYLRFKYASKHLGAC